MNRAQRRQQRNRSKSFILGASLATGALVGYVGYSRVIPAFANTSCVVDDEATGTSATSTTFADCLADTNVTTITFDSSISRITMDSDNSLGFEIDRSLIIDGISGRSGRMVFDGAENYRIFDVSAGKLTLKGLTFEDGRATNGGAILGNDSDGQVDFVLEDVYANNNEASSVGGFIYADGYVKISGTTSFTGNSAISFLGGVIRAGGDVTVSGASTFDDNDADSGGAIAGYGDVTISGTGSFTNNYASSSGGAIYATSNYKITIHDSPNFQANTGFDGGGALSGFNVEVTGDATFSDNVSGNLGGGAIKANNNLTISGDPTFTSNSTYGNGGAIHQTGATTMVISGDAKFYANGNVTANSNTYTATNGGAVYSGQAVTISGNVVLNGNSATNYGGAIYAGGDVTLTTTGGGSFGSNAAGNEAGVNGGAIRANNLTSTSTSLSFTNNDALKGGAIYTQLDTSLTGKSIFTNNGVALDGETFVGDSIYGGAIFAGRHVTLNSTVGNESVFDNNGAKTSGGAVYSGNDVTITHAEFNDSNARGVSGGAVFARMSATVSYATFLNNVAAVGGGAISVGDGFDIDNSSFTSNQAIFGGAVSSGNGNTKSYIDDSTFTTNTSTDSHGGAVYLGDASVEINGSTFTSNTSGASGGAVYGGVNVNVGTSSFKSNSANGAEGGAIYSGNETVIGKSYFDSNTAKQVGGAVRSRLKVNIDDSLFTENFAGFRGDDPPATRSGGGVFTGGEAYVNNSTFYKNSASKGSAIYSVSSAGESFLKFVTVYKNYVTNYVTNYADDSSAAVHLSTGYTYNSIISGNVNDGSSTGLDFKVTGTAYVYNTLFSADGSANGGFGDAINDSYAFPNSKGGNITFGSPRLSVLADNGGPTKTMKPRFGSLAIDTAQTSFTQPVAGDPLEFDQRGELRVFGSAADLGAVELQSAPTPETYTITVSAGANGSISPSGNQTVNELSDNSFTVTPDANYKIASVTVDGASQTVTDTSTFSYSFDDVDQNHIIAATFEPITHTITVTQTANGSISPSTTDVNQGTNETFTVTPNSGYRIASVTVDGTNQTITDSSEFSYTFTGVNQAGTITATFEADPDAAAPSAPSVSSQPTVIISGSQKHSAGDEVIVDVRNWNSTAKILIGGVEAEVVEVMSSKVKFIIPDIDPGSYSLVIDSNRGKVTTSAVFMVEQISVAAEQAEFHSWTKRISDSQVKVYAKNPIGKGKIQFMVNGEEIAWVRAEDEDEPKLRKAQGFYYLVRTVELTPEKQAIEVYLNGERVWRAAYTNK